MRILIIRNAFSYDFGGGERFPVNLAVELTKHGHVPTVVSRSPKLLAFAESSNIHHKKGWWWAQQNWSGKRFMFIPCYILWQLALTLWYIQLIARMSFDVIHPQSKDDFIAATLAGRLLGKKVIWTDHADLKYVLANHTVWYKNPVGKLVYACSKLAATITLVSNSEATLIGEQLGHALPANFTVIYNGVNDTPVPPRPRTKSEQDTFVFCATSRLVVAKGIGELIEAFAKLHEKHAATALWLVGSGPDEQKFRDQAKGNEAIHFFGHSDVPLTFVAACDAFVHPSYHEGFSLSLVEAAMLAKPILACTVGGNVEIIHDQTTGLLVPPRNAASLQKAMEQLLIDSKLARRLGTAARTLYEKQFNFERIVTERFVPLYE
ncbi:MAG TPA: glycosyltransferase family 4 protein [Candidatus Saccharimonadales bacterium]|nr:glycosyltransferase family 4 protein [Candidatus Saccharimonadales bacterium]